MNRVVWPYSSWTVPAEGKCLESLPYKKHWKHYRFCHQRPSFTYLFSFSSVNWCQIHSPVNQAPFSQQNSSKHQGEQFRCAPVFPRQLALLLTWRNMSRSERRWISRYIRARFSAGINQLPLPGVIIHYSNLLKKRIWPLSVFGFPAKAFNKAPTVLAARMYWVVLRVSGSRQELSPITFFSARIKYSTSF